MARGRSAQECFQGLREAYGDAALPYRTVAQWVKAFREGKDAVQDNFCTERPRVEDNTVQLLASLLDADRRWTARSSRTKKVRPTQSAMKVMFIVAYDIDGVILHHAVPPRQTANAAPPSSCPQEKTTTLGGPLAPLAIGDSGTSTVLTRYDPCDYDLFTRVKEPLRGTWYNTRDELIRAIGRSIWNINTHGSADGVRRLPNIWQKGDKNILLLSVEFPQNIIPKLITEWKYAKYIVFKHHVLVDEPASSGISGAELGFCSGGETSRKRILPVAYASTVSDRQDVSRTDMLGRGSLHHYNVKTCESKQLVPNNATVPLLNLSTNSATYIGRYCLSGATDTGRQMPSE
ncbi:hypothetical protein ANN_02081 [Periplaneta americana]|uniref:Mos1 transposase HTH domain-containing protein n=1 Tax=Periplaneta americana TaxID=6978 RepID=A0ABQ8TX28_PERAM|nr:hypothetical protein ANN_02081 [Periplaneta americana]